MRLWVIDTNVVVSGLLNPHGPSARVLNAVLEGRITMVYDARILAEYRDVLYRPRFKLPAEKIQAFLIGLGGQMMVTPATLAAVGPDPDDIAFVEAALTVPDRTVVTGNLAHYPTDILHGVRVIAPAQAMAELASG
jgi:putative PIN family toxin of toxin-antitoxin system